MTLQDIVATLARYWGERGCLLQQPWDAEVGAGTMHPETFLRVLGPVLLQRGDDLLQRHPRISRVTSRSTRCERRSRSRWPRRLRSA